MKDAALQGLRMLLMEHGVGGLAMLGLLRASAACDCAAPLACRASISPAKAALGRRSLASVMRSLPFCLFAAALAHEQTSDQQQTIPALRLSRSSADTALLAHLLKSLHTVTRHQPPKHQHQRPICPVVAQPLPRLIS